MFQAPRSRNTYRAMAVTCEISLKSWGFHRYLLTFQQQLLPLCFLPPHSQNASEQVVPRSPMAPCVVTYTPSDAVTLPLHQRRPGSAPLPRNPPHLQILTEQPRQPLAAAQRGPSGQMGFLAHGLHFVSSVLQSDLNVIHGGAVFRTSRYERNEYPKEHLCSR